MIVIGHEAIGNDTNVEVPRGFFYRFKKHPVILSNEIDPLAACAAVHDVIESVRILYSKRPGHGKKVTEDLHAVKKRLDPFTLNQRLFEIGVVGYFLH